MECVGTIGFRIGGGGDCTARSRVSDDVYDKTGELGGLVTLGLI
jgi:hypothetical protein